uniref:Gap junction protein beta 4 n=1 Tax=Anolis carolinensis TaxID=28377 RepID=A0A803TQE2_ANOCA|nr:PREDICTED: gap junction beta-4 protein-like [Anolis carolinensis]|eukprot:XP_003228231.1 PREDICTED: gap junction beta-4 protein-like [Anolis carolinensis]
MNWSSYRELLSGVNKYSTVVGRVWLTVVFVFRFLVYVVAAEDVWSEDQQDFVCNTGQLGCTKSCYNQFFPISHIRLWALQLILVTCPSLLVLLHVTYREAQQQKHIEEAGKRCRSLYSNFRKSHGGLWWTYFLSILVKVAVDLTFLYIFHCLYPNFKLPTMVTCDAFPCPNVVTCFISKTTEKNIFSYFMAAIAMLCVILNICEVGYVVVKKCTKISVSKKPVDVFETDTHISF